MSKPDIDGGWAWWVLIASFFCQLLVSGLGFISGMFQVVFLTQFQDSVTLTSWVTGIFYALLQLSGPLSSLVSNTMNCRTSVMLGGGLMTIGLFLSALVNSLEIMLVTFGVIAGLGMGLVYTASIVVVNFFFDSKLILVNGIVSSAGGLGILIAPQFSHVLFDNFSWRGTLFLLAGFSANLCVAGALMFPVHEKRSSGVLKRFLYCSVSQIDGPTENENDEHISETERMVLKNKYNEEIDNFSENGNKEFQPNAATRTEANTTNDIGKIWNGQDVDKVKDIEKTKNDYEASKPRDQRNFKNILFLLLSVYLFVNSVGAGSILIHIPSLLKQKGLKKDEITNILSMNGVGMLLGRSLMGALANNRKDDHVLLLIFSTILGGAMYLVYPILATDYVWCMLLMLLLSLYCTAPYSLLPSLTIRYVGLESLNTAFGVEMVCCGAGFLIGPPLAGIVVDATLSYDYNMMIGGTLFGTSSLILMVLPRMERKMGLDQKPK